MRDLVMLHSSDPLSPYLSLWARVPGVTVGDIEAALYERRSLWRLHTIRRTIWVVPREFGPTALGGGTAAVAVKERRGLLKFIAASEVHPDPDAWLNGLAGDVLEALDGAEPMPMSALGEVLPELRTPVMVGSGKWAQPQPVGSKLLFLMAMEGLIARGRPLGSWRASQYRWARTEQWFDQPLETLSPAPADPARVDFLRAYLACFGPVTTEDVRWWTGWTKRDSMAALGTLGAVEVTLDHGEKGWVLPDDTGPIPAPAEPAVALLPGLDPTAMGWKGRDWYLGELTEFGGPLFDRNGNVGPTVWAGGRVIGGWAQRGDGQVVTRLLVDVGQDVANAVTGEAERLTAWLSGDAGAPTVVVPRFRTPLEKELANG